MTSFLITGTDTTAETLTGFETGVVAPGALLAVATGTAVTLGGTAPYLAVLGTILSSTGSRGVGNDGVTIAGSATINVGAAGAIMAPVGDGIGMTITGSGFALVNDGVVSGATAVRVEGTASTGQTASIFNNGTLSSRNSGILGGGSLENLSLTNTGTVQSGAGRAVQHQGTGQLSISNTGTIMGTGSATIETFGSLDLTNTGTVAGDIRFQNAGVIDNSGLIEGNISDTDLSTVPSSQGMTVRNAGTITGNVNLGNGNDSFFDLGGTVGGTVSGGAGNDIYFVRDASLRIVDSSGAFDQISTSVDYRIGRGIETLFADTQNGLHLWGSAHAESIVGNVGNDTIEGGGGNDTMFGQSGEDFLYGGRGDDQLQGNASADLEENHLFGGEGNDALFWSGAAGILNGGNGRDGLAILFVGSLAVDVDLQAGTAALFNTGNGLVTATVVLTLIEDAWGTDNNDTLNGSTQGNALDGQDGNDSLDGFGGNDSIYGGGGADDLVGGSGNDLLDGGLGRDTLTGGTFADTFVFSAISDSAVGASDLITDFGAGVNSIDLSLIDADLVTGGDQGFVFNGTAAFSGTGPQVRFFQDSGAGQTIVQVRLANSASADMEIALTGLFNLLSDQFAL